MGVTIQQWRCAIGKPSPHWRVKKESDENREVVKKIGDEGRRLLATMWATIMWVLLANWVISGSDTLSVFEENIFKIKLEETTGLAASHGIEKLAVIRNLLVIGGVEENPGPKLNLYRLLRQIERSEDEMEFLRTQNLLPRTIDCCKTLGKVFPQNNPEANFQVFLLQMQPKQKGAAGEKHLLLPFQHQPLL